MKKFLTLFLTLMLGVCCAFAVACGGNTDNGNNQGDNGGNNQDTVYTVSESQFNSAMDITGASFQLTVNEIESGDPDNYVTVVNYNPGKIYMSETWGAQSEESYFSLENNVQYRYSKENGVWTKEAAEGYNGVLLMSSPNTIISREFDLTLGFSDFTYNSTLKAYAYTLVVGENSLAITISFQNYKVTTMTIVITEIDGSEIDVETVNFAYTYNNTAVTLPSVGGNSPVDPNPDQGGDVVGGDSSCQHQWEKISLNNGIMTYDCIKCGADKTQNKTQLYANVSSNIANSIFALAEGNDQGASKFGASVSEDYNWIDADWGTHGMNVKGVVMFVKMLADMMVNPNFNVTSAPVEFTYSYDKFGEEGSAILMYDFDEENNKVAMYWNVTSSMGGGTTVIFMHLDIDYDFATDSLVAFEIDSKQSSQSMSIVFGYKYSQSEFKFTVDPNFISKVESSASVLMAEMDNLIDLKADFTKEYSDMMDEMNGSQGGGDDPTPDTPNPDEPSKPVIPSAICGTYELSCLKVSSKGINLDVSVGEALPDDSGILSANDFVIVLNSNGTYSLSGSLFTDGIVNGTFEYAEGEIIFDLERIQSEEEQISVYFENQYLVFSISIPSEATTNSFYTILQGSGLGDIPVDPNPDNPNPGDKPIDPNPDNPNPGQQLTEAQFNSALDIFNLSFTVEITDTEGVSGFSQAETITFIYSPSAVKIIKRGVEGESIRFYEVKNGEIFEYHQSENGWMKDCDQEWTKEVYEAELTNYTALILKAMGLTYNSFTFDTEKGCYVYSGNIMNGISLIFNITFDDDAKLSSLNYQMSMTQEGMTYSQIFDARYTFGAVNIQLPQDYTEVGGGNPDDPKPDDGSSAEWEALFDLENVTVNLESVLDAYWLIDGDKWFAHVDRYAVDYVVQNFVEAWYDGKDAYLINGNYVNGDYVFTGEYTSLDNISVYYDMDLLYTLNQIENAKDQFDFEEVDVRKYYRAKEIYSYGYLLYKNIEIVVFENKLESIEYTIPNGYEFEGEKSDLTQMITFDNYGETVCDFPVINTPSEDPEEQNAFVFTFRSIIYGSTEYEIGDTLYGNLITENFAKFNLYEDGTATLVSNGTTSTGFYEICGDEIYVDINDGANGSNYKFYVQYNEQENYVSFKISGFTYKFDMPENVSYQDVLGEPVEVMYCYLDRIEVGDNVFNVGDNNPATDTPLTKEDTYLAIFQDGHFRLKNIQTTLRGTYDVDMNAKQFILTYLEGSSEETLILSLGDHDQMLTFEYGGLNYFIVMYDGEEPNDPPQDKPILGVYSIYSMSYGGEEINLGDMAPWGRILTADSLLMELCEDNVARSINNMNATPEITEGTWSLEGDYIEIILNGFPQSGTLIDGVLSVGIYVFVLCTGDLDDTEMVTTVTEEQFNKAINLRDVAFFANTYSVTVLNGSSSEANVEVYFKDGNLLAYQFAEGVGTWVYYINVDGTYHMFNSVDFQTWEEVPGYPADMGYMQAVVYYTPYGMIDMLGLTYADFIYDEEYGYYVYTLEEPNGTTELRLGFINGVAQYVEVIVEQISTSMSMTQCNQSFISLDFEDIYFPTYEEVINGSSNVGGDVNEKVFGVYKLVRFENIVGESAWNYLVGEKFHGEILSEDDFTLTLYRDGSYKIAGYLYAEMEGTFVYENGELILDLENIQSEYEQITVYFENDNLIFVVADPSEDVRNVYYTTYYGSSDVTGGDDQYEDATWGKVYKAYQVEIDGEVYYAGETLPNGVVVDESWIVVEVYSNNSFYITISSINYHIEGKWENVYDNLSKLTYVDEEGEDCSIYVDVNNQTGLYTLEIAGYYITLELHYSSENDSNQGEEDFPSENLPSVFMVGVCADYEPFVYYDEQGNVVGFDIDLIKEIANYLGYSEDQIEIIVVDEFSNLLSGLGRGVYDIAIAGIPLTPERADTYDYTDSYISYLATWEDGNGEVVQEWEDYVIFAYENAQLINNINKAIKQLKANGYIDNLASTWLGQDQDKVDNNFNQSGSDVIIIDGTTSKQNYGFGN